MRASARVRLRMLLSAALLAAASGAGAEVALHGVRVAPWEDRFRVVLDLDGETTYRERVLTDPDRIVIEIPGVAVPGLDLPAIKDRVVKAVRANALPGPVLQLVIDLARPSAHKSLTVPAGEGRTFRIVCDVMRSAAAPTVPVTPEARDWVIVIDPGHGGHDPGVVSRAAGLEEKEIVLDVALRLQKILGAQEGVQAKLTRTGDRGLKLARRVQLAEELQGDAFVSIHVNGCPSTAARGAEVFFLSLRGASDAEAHAVAELENAADEADLPVPDEIARLPFGGDLIQTATHQRSALLAEVLLEGLGESRLAAARGVKQANFVVLRSYRVPSALVELGFLSNPSDARNLASSGHRQALAETLARGLLEYRRRCGHPEGTHHRG